MRVICCADTHLATPDLPKGDLLVIAGDLTYQGSAQEYLMVKEWFKKIKYDFPLGIYYCSGNHDFNPILGKSLLLEATNANDRTYTFQGSKKIHFCPWVPTYGSWAFMKSEKELEEVYAGIPDGLDLLVTHGPPYGILDQNRRGDLCGSKALLARLETMKASPKHHVMGHIHKHYDGVKHINHGVVEKFGTKFYNVSIMNEDYAPVNKPLVLEI